MLVEIQALVVPSPMVSPRRSATGFDSGRLALLLAVLDQRAGLCLGRHDVYVSAVGGVRIVDPGADLAVCLALASAATGVPVGDDVVVLGEIGLAGEVRQVSQTPRRLTEAARLGFTRAVVPDRGPGDGPVALCRVPPCRTLWTASWASGAPEPSAAVRAAPCQAAGWEPDLRLVDPAGGCVPRARLGPGGRVEGSRSGRIVRWNAPAPP